jgi:hypothetical protein
VEEGCEDWRRGEKRKEINEIRKILSCMVGGVSGVFHD